MKLFQRARYCEHQRFDVTSGKFPVTIKISCNSRPYEPKTRYYTCYGNEYNCWL